MRLVRRIWHKLVQQVAKHLNHINVRLLVASAHVVGFADPSLFKNGFERTAMIDYK